MHVITLKTMIYSQYRDGFCTLPAGFAGGLDADLD